MSSMYVTLQHTYACECSSTEVIAVSRNSHTCVLAILRTIFSGLTFNYYDPQKRWYLGGDDWIDNWSCGTGVSDFRVEKWLVNERLTTYHYDFDTFLKRKVIREQLTSAAVRQLLLAWRASVLEDIVVPADLAAISVTKDCLVLLDDRKKWVQRHGSTEPYPGGAYAEL
ncbi:hypothetical protein JKP88DRAFT_273627 [Tribonema minus]|uniref:Uncharacterized protein n=1 Tax=Tribonema minus TaxID=303371 RepID=A0A835YQQ3_9STRA|nr:hypothetical protein JKP88DRAFT_273627 [Tribonema minus]